MKNQLLILLVVLTCYVSQYLSTPSKPKRLEEIESVIKAYAKKYPKLVTLSIIGKSIEKRAIYCLKIHDQNKTSTKNIVLNFGIHPREYASQLSSLFVIKQLLTNPKLRSHITTTTWYIIPSLNPDGQYHATKKLNLWRKNRRRLPGSKCFGVDLNRNFPVGWEKKLATDAMKCNEEFAGSKPFSEPETQTLRNILKKIKVVSAFVDIHSCAQTILHPYGYTKEKMPAADLARMTKVGLEMQKAMKKVRGVKYPVQSAANYSIAGGATDDFAYKTMKIPIAFTLELGDDYDSSFKCFFATAEKITQLQRECLQGLLALNTFLHRKAPSETAERRMRPIF